jgi:small subunit ribosomal protein S2
MVRYFLRFWRFFIMKDTTIQTLMDRMFKAGAHFGFSKSRRHPSVTPYLFGTKQGFDIFDLEKTSALLSDATAYMQALGMAGKNVLVVGTKEETASLIRAEAVRSGVPFAVNRWVGGTLTNSSQIKKRVEYLISLRAESESGELERKYTKKERVMLGREMERLEHSFEGIVGMERAPDALLVLDPRHEAIAVAEAHQAGIPVVAIMSSDCNARDVEKPVVVNDAHKTSVALALSELLNAFTEGRSAHVAKKAEVKTEVVA